jgi:hypothetical protein
MVDLNVGSIQRLRLTTLFVSRPAESRVFAQTQPERSNLTAVLVRPPLK